jgi:hypothetical protein
VFPKLCQQTFFIALSVVTFTKPSFGKDEYDKDTVSTIKGEQEKR